MVIDVLVRFGRSRLVRSGIGTATIADRIDAGESVDDVASDYDLTREEIEAALVYERAT